MSKDIKRIIIIISNTSRLLLALKYYAQVSRYSLGPGELCINKYPLCYAPILVTALIMLLKIVYYAHNVSVCSLIMLFLMFLNCNF